MADTTEPAQVLVYVEGAIADPLRVVLPLTHMAGGSEPTTQPNAPSLTFQWLGPLTFNSGEDVYQLTIGTRIGLSLNQAGGGLWTDTWESLWSPALPAGVAPIPPIPRFQGRITDLEAATDSEQLLTNVTCIGTSGEAQSWAIGGTDLPAQTEAQRVAAYMAQAPYVIVNQAGTVGLLLRKGNRLGTLEALQEAAESTGARVWEDGRGQIQYTGLDARKAATAGATLDEFDILAPAGWAQHVGGLINDVSIFYGPDPVAPATVRAFVNVSNASSVNRFGRQHQDIDTQLTTDDDATAFALVVLSHWAEPWWDAPLVAVRADTLDATTWAALMNTQVGQILTTYGLTGEPSTPAGVGQWLVEGWVQTWNRDDTGRLTDEIQLAVSEYERWVADGKHDSTITAVAAPTSNPYLTPITVTATVLSQSLPVTTGTVEVWDGNTFLGSGALAAGGHATISVKPQPGDRILTVRFTGTAAVRASDTALTVTVTPVTTTTVGLVMSPTTVNEGGKVSLTATVSPVGATGSVRWEFTRDGGAWQVWSGQDSSVSATTGKATATWTVGGAGRAYVWRAVYVPTAGSPFAGATSGTVAVTVKLETSQTLTYSASYAATYQSDGDKRSDTDDLYQGYYSSTNGRQRSIAGFPSMAGDWSGAEITKVEVWLETPHWQSASGGTAVIGSYTGGSEPSSWPSSGLNTDRTRSSFDRGQGKWVAITDWGKGYATGSLRGIVLGPGPSDSGEYYGYATGTGSDRPKLRITGKVYS